MTQAHADVAARDRTKRAIYAMPLAMVSFTVPYVVMFGTIRWTQPAGNEGFADLAYFASLLVLGVVLVAVVIPVVVFTLGKALDHATRAWKTAPAVGIFGGAGLLLGVVLATLLAWVADVAWLGAIANVAIPAALGGLITRLLLPVALTRRWFAVLTWVGAAIPLAGAMVLVLSLGLA